MFTRDSQPSLVSVRKTRSNMISHHRNSCVFHGVPFLHQSFTSLARLSVSHTRCCMLVQLLSPTVLRPVTFAVGTVFFFAFIIQQIDMTLCILPLIYIAVGLLRNFGFRFTTVHTLMYRWGWLFVHFAHITLHDNLDTLYIIIRFNIQKFPVLPTKHFRNLCRSQHKLGLFPCDVLLTFGFYSREVMCLMCGTYWLEM